MNILFQDQRLISCASFKRCGSARFEIVDGYVAANEHDLVNAAHDMSAGLGDVTIILVKS